MYIRGRRRDLALGVVVVVGLLVAGIIVLAKLDFLDHPKKERSAGDGEVSDVTMVTRVLLFKRNGPHFCLSAPLRRENS